MFVGAAMQVPLGESDCSSQGHRSSPASAAATIRDDHLRSHASGEDAENDETATRAHLAPPLYWNIQRSPVVKSSTAE